MVDEVFGRLYRWTNGSSYRGDLVMAISQIKIVGGHEIMWVHIAGGHAYGLGEVRHLRPGCPFTLSTPLNPFAYYWESAE